MCCGNAALDVNIGSLDVLNHKRLLDSARADPSAVSFQVRPVDVAGAAQGNGSSTDRRPSFGNLDTLLTEVRLAAAPCFFVRECCGSQQLFAQAASAQAVARSLSRHRSLPRPAFGSSPNLQVGGGPPSGCFASCSHRQVADREPGAQALVLEAEERLEGARSAGGSPETCFFEVTVASVDQPKLLSRLSECLVRARTRATRHPASGHARCSPSQTAVWGTPQRVPA